MPTRSTIPSRPQPVRSALTDPEKAKIQSAHDKLKTILTRESATSEPLTDAEWKSLGDADDLLKEALGESTTTAAAVFERRRFAAKLYGGIR